MTPTVQTLGEKIHQQLVNAGVSDCAHAVRVLALHARRTRLTREQLVDLLSRFEPGDWDLGTTTAAERLLQDRGETPDAALLAYEVGHLHGRILLHGAPPWPADDAGPAEVAEAALAETCGLGRDGEDQAQPNPWDGSRQVISLHARIERLQAHWGGHIGQVVLTDPDRHLSVHLDPGRARAIGRELIAAADEAEARDDTVGEQR